MDASYQRHDLGSCHAYVAEGSQYGEHWVEVYLTLPGSQKTLLMTILLNPFDANKAMVTAIN
jgi:hypothetical protein